MKAFCKKFLNLKICPILWGKKEPTVSSPLFFCHVFRCKIRVLGDLSLTIYFYLYCCFYFLKSLLFSQTMANLFSNMTGFTFPNTVTNQGPLPPNSVTGVPKTFQTPDGLINETNSLLSNVTAYSYGENSQRLSTQTSYVNHPHRIQKVIPKIFIPTALGTLGEPDIPLQHALHDGDLTFTLRMPKDMICGKQSF